MRGTSKTPSRHARGAQVGADVPAELEQAFRDTPDARILFDDLSPVLRREYAQWILDGRRGDVRARRAAQTVMRLLERQ